MDFDKNLTKRKDSLPITTTAKEHDILKKHTKNSKRICDASGEIQYVIPEDIKVIHLVKGPLKSRDKNLEDKYRQSQDFTMTFPEKLKIHEDTSFVRKETKKPVNLKVDSIPPTKYTPSHEFGKNKVDVSIF